MASAIVEGNNQFQREQDVLHDAFQNTKNVVEAKIKIVEGIKDRTLHTMLARDFEILKKLDQRLAEVKFNECQVCEAEYGGLWTVWNGLLGENENKKQDITTILKKPINLDVSYSQQVKGLEDSRRHLEEAETTVSNVETTHERLKAMCKQEVEKIDVELPEIQEKAIDLGWDTDDKERQAKEREGINKEHYQKNSEELTNEKLKYRELKYAIDQVSRHVDLHAEFMQVLEGEIDEINIEMELDPGLESSGILLEAEDAEEISLESETESDQTSEESADNEIQERIAKQFLERGGVPSKKSKITNPRKVFKAIEAKSRSQPKSREARQKMLQLILGELYAKQREYEGTRHFLKKTEQGMVKKLKKPSKQKMDLSVAQHWHMQRRKAKMEQNRLAQWEAELQRRIELVGTEMERLNNLSQA